MLQGQLWSHLSDATGKTFLRTLPVPALVWSEAGGVCSLGGAVAAAPALQSRRTPWSSAANVGGVAVGPGPCCVLA